MEGPGPVEILPGLYALDLRPLGIENFLSTYVMVGREALVVDCGPACSIGRLIEGLEAVGVKPESLRYILATHIHIDHVGGASELLNWAPDAELLVHERGVKHMVKPDRLWEGSLKVLGQLAEAYGPIGAVDEDRVAGLREGDTVELAGGPVLEVLETPGHASHHVSFFDGENRILFPGDSAGIYIAPLDLLLPTTPSPHRLDLTFSSLDKQSALRPEVACYPHFWASDRASELLDAYRRQLEVWARVIGDNVEEDEEELLGLLASEDGNIARVMPFLDAYPLLRGGLLRSIRGIKEFLSSGGAG
ncbi:hypothetical protein DRO32_00650 [Candidatus Bathyarchaeota archaeon]|nr:MAG: hypothetical protein DRO32_00650 [Candidatus Bathyarchaeota archaeon]